MSTKQNLWYQVGYALETARKRLPPSKGLESGTAATAIDGPQGVTFKVVDALLTVGAGSVLARVLSLWPSRNNPGLFRLMRGGAAGAAAAFLAELARPALTGKDPERPLEAELTDVLLAGAGRGLLYAALVEPRVPGPTLLRGAAYAGLEYALSPWGGLANLAGNKAPQGKIPALSVLLKDRRTEEQLIEHVAFGVALAILYDR